VTRRNGHRTLRGDDGFTLVELVVAIGILGIIIAPLSMAFITSLRVIGRADQRLNDSRSALITSAYFANDIASSNVITLNDTAACGSGTAVVSFVWSSASSPAGSPVNNKVSYVIDASDSTNHKLVRRYCAGGGTAKTSTAAISLADSNPVTVTCYSSGNVADATCGSATRSVKMVVTTKANTPTPDNLSPTPFTFTLEGTRRSI
jgi:prepilin-type N-terminal cleavage/methylation domain-containing protein